MQTAFQAKQQVFFYAYENPLPAVQIPDPENIVPKGGENGFFLGI